MKPLSVTETTIKADQIDQLGRSVLPKCLYRLPIDQLGQCAVMEEGGRDVVSDRFLAREVTGALAGEDGGQFVIGQAAAFRGDHVGVSA